MKRIVSILSLLILLVSCKEIAVANNLKPKNNIKVKNLTELQNAIKNSTAGDNIILANGIWKDAEIKFYGKG